MAGGGGKKLDQTPTWAVAAVCTAMILISFVLEKALHKIGTWLMKKQKKAVYEALDRIKGELMVLGFISLLLTFSQQYIEKISVKSNVAKTMLPCELYHDDPPRRHLLWNDQRILVSTTSKEKDTSHKDYKQLISAEGVHEVHILIFLLAVFHVFYSAVTILLGRLKIRGWKKWEHEIATTDYESAHDPSRFRFTHETSFVRAHSSFWTKIPFFFYVGCFFRQFFRSVTKTDYMTLRNGFIMVHLAPGSKFNFQKYIKRSLEHDFKVLVSVSPLLWASFVGFLLLNVYGWHTLSWACILPPIVILAIGMKLQVILAKMALEIKDRHSVVQGMPLVQVSDSHFWFSKPQLLLHLLHFSLFQNAFQITYLLWILYDFEGKSCFHEGVELVVAKIAIGLGALVLCSYSTLPLYALVAQMGSHMKRSIFNEQTSKALERWHMDVKKKQEQTSKKTTRTLGGTSKGLRASFSHHSSGPTLHRFMSTGHSIFPATNDEHNGCHVSEHEIALLDDVVVADNGNGETEMTTLPSMNDIGEENDELAEPTPGVEEVLPQFESRK